MERKLFLCGLLFSFIMHAAVIVVLSLPDSGSGFIRKLPNSIEVTYQNIKTVKKESRPSSKDFKVVKDSKSYQEQKVKVVDRKDGMFSAAGGQVKDISKLSGNLRMDQRKTADISTLDLDRKITLSPITAEKITNPKYLTYNDGMREAISRNIKQRAYTYVNHPDFQAGEVYLTFVLDSNGVLHQVKIIESKTSANEYLRNVAMRSIKESNPFPHFPEGFNYPEFTFNLLISFQN